MRAYTDERTAITMEADSRRSPARISRKLPINICAVQLGPSASDGTAERPTAI